jgi:hypothetical protein
LNQVFTAAPQSTRNRPTGSLKKLSINYATKINRGGLNNDQDELLKTTKLLMVNQILEDDDYGIYTLQVHVALTKEKPFA